MLAASEVEHFPQPVAILLDAVAGAADPQHQSFVLQRCQRFDHGFLVVVDDRISAGLLVARVLERVDRHWVIFRRRHIFLEQRSEDAHFNGM